MIRIFFATGLMATLALGTGCAMCENPFDYEYSAFGGICADGGCGQRAGSIITGPSGKTVEHVVVTDDYPDGLEPTPAEPVPAMPFEMPPEEDEPSEIEPDMSVLPNDGAAPSLDPPAPDPGLFPFFESEPAEGESQGLELPAPMDTSDSGSLPLGPAVAPPLPG